MIDIVLMIIQTALNVATNQVSGNQVLSLADAMVDIIAKAKAAYEAETGQPLDVSKIKPLVPIQ
jgi:hypothetical protein